MPGRIAPEAAPEADRYRVLAGAARAEPPKTKGSRFVGEAFPVASEEDAMAALGAVRRREHAATHHVWAYRLGPEGAQYRASDDGEPAGSSGPPVLRAIQAAGLTDVLVVVTRYYGGTKLGTGGLARAYGEAAALALEAAPAAWRVVTRRFVVTAPWLDTGAVYRIVQGLGGQVEPLGPADDGSAVAVEVPRAHAEALPRLLAEATAGRVKARPAGSEP